MPAHAPNAGWISKGMGFRFFANNAFGIVLMATTIPNLLMMFAAGNRKMAFILVLCLCVGVFAARRYFLAQYTELTIKLKYKVVNILLYSSMFCCVVFAILCPDRAIEKGEIERDHRGALIIFALLSFVLSIASLSLFMYFEQQRHLIARRGVYDLDAGVFRMGQFSN